jgi:hypothetical protein
MASTQTENIFQNKEAVKTPLGKKMWANGGLTAKEKPVRSSK